MRTVKFSFVLFASVFFCGSFTGHAYAQIEKQREALKAISDFAGEICNKIPFEGHSSNLELNGEAKAELNGLLKKVAGLGIAGKGKYTEEEYIGVLQSELAGMLTKNADCKLKVFNTLQEKLLPQSPSMYNTDDLQSNKKKNVSGKHEIEPNNNFSQANEIENGIILSGESTYVGGEWDFFKFSSEEGNFDLIFDVEGSTRDYKVNIFDKTRRNIMSYNVDGGEKIVKTIRVPAGIKFISVVCVTCLDPLPYKLSINY